MSQTTHEAPRAFRTNRLQKIAAVCALAVATIFVAQARAKGPDSSRPPVVVDPAPPDAAAAARIEVVFVLDTTGSMSGLIEGAKQEIWSIASRMAGANQDVNLRVGLLGYRDRGDAYVTRHHALSDDLDAVYADLRQFQAGGGGDGPESVNQALHEAVTHFGWSSSQDVYKVVFLVGDAPPHMDYNDDVKWAESVRLARGRGILINTVQCGSQADTTRFWQQIASAGAGQYAAIAQDGGMVAIHAPMDDELVELNRKLAATVLPYGSPDEKDALENKVDNALNSGRGSVAARLSYLAKSGEGVVSGASDLLDAVKGGLDLDSVEEDALPEAMRPMSPPERQAAVKQNLEEREAIQERIRRLSGERDSWMKSERARLSAEGAPAGFDERVMQTVKDQAASKGITYAD